MSKQEQFLIAQVGRTVGLWGDLKFHLHTDFPEQFIVGQSYKSDRGLLEILEINMVRGIIKFRGYETLDSAKRLTNAKIYATKDDTQSNCQLNDGEYFWFDIMDSTLLQDGEVLGVVTDIQRMLDVDYLVIKTDKLLVDSGLPNSFLVPYIPRYIIKSDVSTKEIFTKDAKDILEAS
jgi:16S rRNA processing protein RimM